MKASFRVVSKHSGKDSFGRGLTWLSEKVFEAIFWGIIFECNGPFHSLYYYGSEVGKKAFRRMVNQTVREGKKGVFKQELVYPNEARDLSRSLQKFELLLQNLYSALLGWARGEGYTPFVWQTGRSSPKDGSYPIDNGVSVSGDTVRIWVYNSKLEIVRAMDNEFQFFAEGRRHSFSGNFTGSIPLKIWEESKPCSVVTDLSVESQGQPWDCASIERIFSPTLEFLASVFLFGGEYEDGICAEIDNDDVQYAAKKLIEALQGKRIRR